MTRAPHARAKAVFLEAVTRPAASRRAWVIDACAGDTDLQREVESLLAFHDEAQSRLTGATTTTPHQGLVQHARLSIERANRSWPSHLVRRAARRLQIVCFAITATVLVQWVGLNLIQGEFGDEFRSPWQWLPPVSMLLASMAMLAAARWGFSSQALIRLGLLYEVLVSIAIALSQYAGAFSGVAASQMNADRVGLSYVATWMLFFTVLVPARPTEAMLALIASAAAVPMVYLHQVSLGLAPALDLLPLTSLFVWPYAAAVAGAYIAARIVHQLGVEVREAQELGGYRMEALLGRGGMGEVWRASHHTLARSAAIKVIRHDTLGLDPVRAAAAAARFEAEAQVIASLESPHTVQLYDFGRTDEGLLFYVMELLHGVDLEALVRRGGALPPARVVHILRQVCASLDEAHHRGLVHADIKPANIFLCRRALEDDVVKVLDFGLATAFSDVRPGPAPRFDAIIGTPDYMAPELAQPGLPIDGRTDLYGVGCVAFWLLTGRVVFPRESVADRLEAHRTARPEAPSALGPGPIPEALDRLVVQCLEKSPDRRPASARDVTATLGRLAVDLPWPPAAPAGR